MIASRSQKIRLAIFLVTSITLLIFSLIYLVGTSLLQARDSYRIVLQGGSGGLEIGGQVRYNGINIGRVETVSLNPENPSEAIVMISVTGGTPITKDTVAVPEFAGVTGTKLLALTGGTKVSERHEPGDTIASTQSDFSLITTKLTNISVKIEDLLDNLVAITDDTNAHRVTAILTEFEISLKSINHLIESQTTNIDQTMQSVANITEKFDQSMNHVNAILFSADDMSKRLLTRQNANHISSMLGHADEGLAFAKQRLSDEELGETIASVNRLSYDTHVAVLRLRDDLRRTLSELERSMENISEFTQILVDTPSALISGRKEKERALP